MGYSHGEIIHENTKLRVGEMPNKIERVPAKMGERRFAGISVSRTYSVGGGGGP
jgi:hypothetical protein